MAHDANVVVKSDKDFNRLLEKIEGHLDETKSERVALEARADKMDTEVQQAIQALAAQEEKWTEMKARMDRMDALLPKGNKVYMPHDGSAPQGQVREGLARFILDGMSHSVNRKAPFGSEEFKRALDDMGQSYKNDGSDNVGGYLVPDNYRQEIWRVAASYGLARKLFRTIPLQGYVLHMPTHAGGPEIEWVGDADQNDGGAAPDTGEGSGPADSTQAKFGRVTMRSARLMAIDTLSMEISEWAIPVIQDFLIDVFAEKLAEAEDKAAFIGDGSATYGGFTGVTNASGVNTVYLGGASNSGKTAFTDLRYKDLLNVMDAPNEFTAERGVWVMSNSIVNLIRKLREDEGAETGRPLWSEMGSEMISGNPPALFGRPYYRSAVMNKQSTASQAGKHLLWYGDPKYALLGQSMNLRIDFSPHADFKKGNIVMRVMERVGFLVALGSPFAVLKASST